MDPKTVIEEKLSQLRPILASAGRSVELLECGGDKAVVKLTGFCGGCACSESYKEGVNDLISSACPEIKQIEFIEVE